MASTPTRPRSRWFCALPEVLIRRIAPGDGELLRRARIDAVTDTPEAFGVTLPETLARTTAQWDERCRSVSTSENEAMWIAIADGHPVGLMGVFFSDEYAAWVLISVYVHESQRGSSLATDLHDTVLAWLRERGATHLYLEVWHANPRAIRFYERLGYSFTGNSRPHDKYPGETELEMLLTL